MQLTSVLLAPVVTEKSAHQQGQGKYTFRVHSDANKIQVAQAVEAAYGVQISAVNILPVRKKQRMVGRGKFRTKRPASKRAIVTTVKKQSIDFNQFKSTKSKSK